MNISVNDAFNHSFVMSIDVNRYKLLCETFRYVGLPLPRLFIGKTSTTRCKGGADETHLSIIEYAKRNNWPFVMVFEDDALPRKDAYSMLEYYLTGIPLDTQLLQLAWSNNQNSHEKKFNRIINPAFCIASYICFQPGYDIVKKLLTPAKIQSTDTMDCI